MNNIHIEAGGSVAIKLIFGERVNVTEATDQSKLLELARQTLECQQGGDNEQIRVPRLNHA
jgi:hypothetical protein